MRGSCTPHVTPSMSRDPTRQASQGPHNTCGRTGRMDTWADGHGWAAAGEREITDGGAGTVSRR